MSGQARGFRPILAALTLAPGALLAQQNETTVICDEGIIAEPVSMAHGDATAGCAIDTATDSDLFLFEGVLGELIRLNVQSTTSNLDPMIELRDDMGTLIDSGNCSNFACSFTRDVVLPRTGSYVITVRDLGGNEGGGYQMQLERLTPPMLLQRIDYNVPVADAIGTSGDVDHFFFNAAAGTKLRFNVQSTTSNLDPTIEIRGPIGALVVNGGADGASCANFACTFSIDLSPTLNDLYSLIMYDGGINEGGGYEISIWCLDGACDSDGVPPPDPDAPLLAYDDPQSGTIGAATAAVFYRFNATAGTDIRFNAQSTSSDLDPTMEIRDPTGAVVINGGADGAACANFACSFSVDYSPATDGFHSILIYDGGTNEGGNFELSVWCINGRCNSDGMGDPDRDGPLVNHIVTRKDAITEATDGDFFRINLTAGNLLRVNGQSTSSNLDPVLEIRDPNGELVLGPDDGLTCPNFACSFSVPFSPVVSGMYSILVYDSGTNEGGEYEFSILCVAGVCDSDADGLANDDRENLDYGVPVSKAIDTASDADHYLFNLSNLNDQVAISVTSTTSNLDPTVEVRGPTGIVVLDGGNDGASCPNFGCNFVVNVPADIVGTYSLMIYDSGNNEGGGYELGLQCVFGAPPDFTCDDLPDPPSCADNCSVIANPDQRDTNGDGFGNACDADLTDDGAINFEDLGLIKMVFFMTGDLDADLDGDGSVNFVDLGLMKEAFFGSPGPSCAAPNSP